MHGYSAFAGLALVGLATASADAGVVISDAPTQNMACSGGVCTPTAANAVLNLGELEVLLQSGPAEVTTTGSDVQADSIVIRNSLSWTTPNALTLDAYLSITIDSTVSVNGVAGLSLVTNDGGTGGSLTFGTKGHVIFPSLSSALTINGAGYTLVRDIKTLASDIAANPDGNFALAADYNAGGDGTYTTCPIVTFFSGNFEGLGNTIQNLTISDSRAESLGLFNHLAGGGRISDVGVVNAAVSETSADGSVVGVLVAYDLGSVSDSYSSGTINSVGGTVGGLVGTVQETGKIDKSHSSAFVTIANGNAVIAAGLAGWNSGVITSSYATGAVSNTGTGGYIAGLVSYNGGIISSSFSSGAVSAQGDYTNCGGLAGSSFKDKKYDGRIENSYATGSVTCAGTQDAAGGFAVGNTSSIERSYSTGRVQSAAAGGFLSSNDGSMKRNYWDTTSSGTNIGVGSGSSSGLTGLTTQQLQARLPPGFSPKVWAENPKINSGFPYLIANPPPK